MIFRSVVLPQPEGPSSEVSCAARKIDVDVVERLHRPGIDLAHAAHLDHRVGLRGGSASAALRRRVHVRALFSGRNSVTSTRSISSMKRTEKTMIDRIAAYIFGIVARWSGCR